MQTLLKCHVYHGTMLYINDVLFSLLKELGENIKCEACRAFYFFLKEFNKLINTEAQMYASM